MLLYMSPEQVNGVEAGPRSDIFSFGLVLYEMSTGKRAFEAATAASVIRAILERPAPSVADVAPRGLDRVLKRCLEKDPENWWQTARDLRAALELVAQASEPVAGLPEPGLRCWLWPTLAIAATLATLAFVFLRLPEARPPEPPTVRFQIPPRRNRASTISNCRRTVACWLSSPITACGFDRSIRSRRRHYPGRREQSKCSGPPTASSSCSLREAS